MKEYVFGVECTALYTRTIRANSAEEAFQEARASLHDFSKWSWTSETGFGVETLSLDDIIEDDEEEP
jgi:hypothetical protein